MVAEQPVEGAARPHGDACPARQVVFGHHPAAGFVVAANEQGGGRSYDRFYPISIAIIYEAGRGCSSDRGEAVFVVISEGVSAARDGARGHVADASIQMFLSQIKGERAGFPIRSSFVINLRFC